MKLLKLVEQGIGVAAIGTLALTLGIHRAMASEVLPAATAFASAEAQPEPDPQASVPPGNLPLSVSASFTTPGGDQGSSTATVVGGADPYVSASATVTGATEVPCGGACGAGASASLDYYFEITGPDENVSVLLQGDNSIAESLVTDTGDAESSASVTITDVNGNTLFSSPGAGGSYESTLDLDVGSIYEIALEADAGAGNSNSPNTFSASAFADPTLSILGMSASQYTIDFSSNLATTPLPPALPLFATALGGLILLGWRNKRNVPPAASS